MRCKSQECNQVENHKIDDGKNGENDTKWKEDDTVDHEFGEQNQQPGQDNTNDTTNVLRKQTVNRIDSCSGIKSYFDTPGETTATAIVKPVEPFIIHICALNERFL